MDSRRWGGMASGSIWTAGRRTGVIAALAAVSACQQPFTTRHSPDSAAAQRGRAMIEQVGCGACHEIPRIDWPKGRLAPSLKGFDDVGVIAGSLPNRPGTLAAFIRNAPAVKPGSTMPPMPLTEEQAADIAAYLYGIDDD